MAASRKVEEFDSKGLSEFKKSLICTVCKRPPRPKQQIYVCCSPNQDKCKDVRCQIHKNEVCSHNYYARSDPHLTKFLELINLYNCLYLKNGCQMELEAKDLEAHERTCLFRDVTCPKLGCDASVVFEKLVDHFKTTHSDLEMKEDVLEFKGSLEDLKKKNYILNCYGRPFYPQLYVSNHSNNKTLHFWVVGHGNQDEINSFEVLVKFWINGRTTLAHDFVRKIHTYKGILTSGEDGMVIPVKKVTQYYDVQSKKFKIQEFIEFEMKVTCPKLDEAAKDVNVESGVEDSETEEK